MTFGKEGTSGARVHDIEEVKAILDIFQKHGHKEVDTARNYAAGTSESFLAQVGWQERGLVVDTKVACRLLLMILLHVDGPDRSCHQLGPESHILI